MITVEAPLETVPMFVRAGAIIPTAREMNYVGEKPQDPITFQIYPDEKGSASTTLYEDDGISPAYEKEGFRRTTVDVKRSGAGYAGYVVTTSAPVGHYQPAARKLSFVIKSVGRFPRVATIADDGSAKTIKIN